MTPAEQIREARDDAAKNAIENRGYHSEQYWLGRADGLRRALALLDGLVLLPAEDALALEKAGRERDQLREALAEDPEKWSWQTLVLVARLLLSTSYPADIFTGVSGDPGPRFVARVRDALTQLDNDLALRRARGERRAQ